MQTSQVHLTPIVCHVNEPNTTNNQVNVESFGLELILNIIISRKGSTFMLAPEGYTLLY